jgi:GNAT superfamily N-acetyltransferase
MSDDITLRRATTDDFPRIVELARRALGWEDDDAAFLTWKHLENPFGVSPMWVALAEDEAGERVVGFRTFLRWEFVRGGGTVVRAVRAVDTATDPDHQGRGIFTRLTLRGLEELPSEGAQMVFNTPNDKSLPGYLKMGWTEVGQLATAIMPTSFHCFAVLHTARTAAGRWPVPTELGSPAADAFTDDDGVREVLATQPGSHKLRTRRTPEFYAWRYGFEPLGYRVIATGASLRDGFAVFRRRRRGKALECVLCDVVVPEGDERQVERLLDLVQKAAPSDYMIRLDPRRVTRGPFVRLPRVGPVLTCRPLDESPAPELTAWKLSMGDVELF